MKIKVRIGAVLCIVLLGLSNAQSGTQIQPRKLIDCHTAGALPKGYFDIDFKFFSEGGINSSIGVGLTNRLSLGISYQIMRLIGQRSIKVQSFPGGLFKYRLMEESYYLPGLALGFDSQGSGEFHKEDGLKPRFYYKSKGFFAAISKSYLFLSQPLGFHVECNYSIVDNQADAEEANRSVNLGVGLDKSLNEELSIMCEYDFALDDNYDQNLLKGYLNACFRWAKRLYNPATGNSIPQDMSREVRIVYIDNF
jgi:hypothetical protein